MKTKTTIATLTGLGLLVTALATVAAESVTPVPLRYQFKPGQTNAYRVSLETVFQDQNTALAGIVFVQVRRLDEGVATLGFSGSLQLKSSTSPRPTFPMPYRPGASLWMPRPIFLQPNFEVRVDERGRVVRQWSQGASLPAPFASVLNLFFEPMPATAALDWQSEAEVLIDDETPAIPDELSARYGMMGFGPDRMGAQLTAVRILKARLIQVTESTATIEKKVEITSLLESGDLPRLKAVTEGSVIFDRSVGRLRSVDLRGQTVINTATVTHRRPMTLQVRLLEGEDLANELKALAPPAPARSPVISREELTNLLRDLESAEESTRMTALNRLQTSELDTATPELLAAAVKLAGSPDMTARQTAGHLLGRYGTPNEIPTMLQLLAWGQPGNQREVMEGLRRLKDPRAIEPLADLVAQGSNETHLALEVMKIFGSTAEPVALKLLKERHAQTRRFACNLLAEVGTSKSLDPLRRQMLDPDQEVGRAATDAARAISQRITGKTNGE